MSEEKMDSLKKQFEDIHENGLKGLMRTYGGVTNIFKSNLFILSIIFSLFLLSLLIYNNKGNVFLVSFIEKVSEIGISIDGGLIGLSLAGLTLVVTFGSGNFMNKIIEIAYNEAIKTKEFKSSIYQKMIAKFGFAVFVQIIALLFLVFLKLMVLINIEIHQETALIMNYLAIFFGLFLLTYSLILVLQMVVNIFTIGQKNHLIYYSEITNQKNPEKDSINNL